MLGGVPLKHSNIDAEGSMATATVFIRRSFYAPRVWPAPLSREGPLFYVFSFLPPAVSSRAVGQCEVLVPGPFFSFAFCDDPGTDGLSPRKLRCGPLCIFQFLLRVTFHEERGSRDQVEIGAKQC